MSLSTKLSPRVSVLCVLLLGGTAAAGCGDSTVPDMPDTNVVPHDGGGGSDVGPHDAGPPRPDTGPMPDTGVPTPDTGPMVDAAMVGCGNGMLDSGEECDTAITTGAGACPTAASCNDSIACTADVIMGAACLQMCTHTPITAPSGTTADMCCPTGATNATDTDCSATCGNGMVDTGELCDTGIATGTGSCPTAATCNDAMACTTDVLMSGGTCNAACMHTALTASGPTADTCCPTGANHNTDVDCAAMCGNGVIEAPGETCEPPGTPSCSATCQMVAVAGCGDGVLATGEDCDDSNTRNLDGCDSACHYEAFARLTDLQISTNAAPAMCAHTRNQLGAHALSATAVNGALGQPGLNATLHTDVVDGTLNVILQALGLVDLNAVTDPMFNLGVMSGVPDPAAGAWPAAGNPPDWRFFIDHSGLDAMGRPTALMPGAIAMRNLTSGPATITIPLALGGSVANLTLFNTHAIGTFAAATSHPPYPATPPLRAGLTTFTTIAGNGAGQGLCGDISVGSLALIPIPQLLTMGAATDCTQNYTYCGTGMPVSPTCNSLLDVLVGGCTSPIGFVGTLVAATQPDVGTAGGTVVNLTVSATGHHVTNVAAQANEAYSGFFTFTANRAHASGELCTAASQCQTGQTMCSMTATSGMTGTTPNLICH
jgi:cysteine-rich repeat protein